MLRLIAEAHQRARTALIGHRDALDAIAGALMVEESLDHAALTTLIAAHRPAAPDPAEPSASLLQDSAAPVPDGQRHGQRGTVVLAT